jgi:monoamine oxidase
LKALLGSKADQGFRAGAVTDWGRHPLFLGAFASAKPGAHQARDLLLTPIQERIFLAGEALAGKAAQTVHGAYASGQATARRVISLLNRKRRRSH